jgi:cytidylate kinase
LIVEESKSVHHKLVLVGMMGSGKTTIGKLVSELTGMPFIDTDEEVEKLFGKPVNEIFATEGEAAFRKGETEVLKSLAQQTEPAVIATGGGIIQSEENKKILTSLGTVLFLEAPPEVLFERIKDTASRPLLHSDPLLALKHLARTRRDSYGEVAHRHMDTEEQTAEEIAQKIVDELLGGVAQARRAVEEAGHDTVVAIDGPVASGKSTTAKLLARKLGYRHIDTGAMYRCVAHEALRLGVDLTDAEKITQIATRINIEFVPDPMGPRGQKVLLDGEDVTEAIRAPQISGAASRVADILGVRQVMTEAQKALARQGRCVLEGRDIGTVVCPKAYWKFYVTASIEERVRRRFYERPEQERQEKSGLLEQVKTAVLERDHRDRNRQEGALQVADDATVLDTTGMEMEEVVALLAAMIQPEPVGVA